MKKKDPDKTGIIYQATLRLVQQTGLTGLTMAAIGKATGLGMGTIYVYFPSKEALILSLYKRLKHLNTARIYEGIDLNRPFVLNLRTLVTNYVQNRLDYFEEHFFVEQCAQSHYLDQEGRQMEVAAFSAAHALLDRGKQDFLIKNLDNDALIAFMMGASNEMVRQHRLQNRPFSDQDLEQILLLIWDALKR
jgi:TetR/AcrR family transcriptional regulator, multidrug resistance operon repressor